ncbi:MAG: hypothetical protein ATN35_02465 [Epulopiscium sp. Nele67-Bin004]|nr:MAG: hypothetical protein ATN35_02465 [Epulopiscium sp. Nele67-Bin004]
MKLRNKKLLASLLTASMSLTIVGCSKPENIINESNKIIDISNNGQDISVGQMHWEIDITDIVLTDSLTTVEDVVLYTGEIQKVIHTDNPSANNQYLLLEVTINKVTDEQAVFNVQDMELLVMDEVYQQLPNSFIDKHNYISFPNTDIRFGKNTGYIIFEIPKDSDIENNQLIYQNTKMNLEITQKIVNLDTNIPISLNNIEEQWKIEQQIKQDYSLGKYTINNPYIVQDPYKVAPLTALAIFETDKEAKVTINIEGKDEYTSVINTFEDYDIHHEIPIIGLYADYNNIINITLEYKDGSIETSTLNIQTPLLPNNFTQVDVLVNNIEKTTEGMLFLYDGNKTIIDQNGEVRWYTTEFTGQSYKQLSNGNFAHQIGPSHGSPGQVVEKDLLGKIYNMYYLPEGIHHDIEELPNGNLLLTLNEPGGETIEDIIVEIDRNTGEIVSTIDLKEILDPTRAREIGVAENDWFHMNTIHYYDNSLILSGRTQNAVVKLSYPELEIEWILGTHDEWKEEFKKYLLEPIGYVGEGFEWQWAQHAPMVLPDFDNNSDTIDILLFDNGNKRSLYPETALNATENYSRLIHYRVNEKDMTIEEIWEYGQERGSDMFSGAGSDADYLEESGNYLGTFTSIFRDENGNPTETHLNSVRTSVIVEVDENNNVVWEGKIYNPTGSYATYRAEKMSIYKGLVHTPLGEIKGNDFYKSYKSVESVQLMDVEETKTNSNMRYTIDNTKIINNELMIQGWNIILGETSDNYESSIIFKSDDIVKAMPLELIQREDVTIHFNNINNDTINYNNSGINITIPLSDLEEQLPSGKYTIGLMIEANGEPYYQETEYFITIDGYEEAVQTDIVTEQKVIDTYILNEYNSASYTVSSPYSILNPYGNSPLSALLMFETDKPASITVSIEGKDDLSTITHTFEDKQTSHQIPVYGLYADTNNKVTITATYADRTTETSTVELQTQPFAVDLPNVDIKTIDTTKMANGLTFLQPDGWLGQVLYAIDTNGDIRYYRTDVEAGCVFRILENSRILINDGTHLAFPYYWPYTYETDFLGKVYTVYDTPSIHHEIQELPNGNLLYAGERPDHSTTEDYIVELDRVTGEIVEIWDMQEIIEMDRYIANEHHVINNFNGDETRGEWDWFHMNAVVYVPETNEMVISSRHQDMAISIDYTTKEINWILTDPENIRVAESMQKYLLTPVGEDFEYMYAPHATLINEAGNLMLFDNGTNRTANDDENYSRVVEYKINTDNMTVEQVAQYGKERGSELFSVYMSDIDELAPNHWLGGFTGIVKEPDGSATANMFSILEDGKAQLNVVEVIDGEVVYEVHTRKCPETDHVREEKMYVSKTKKVRKTKKEMKDKYKKNKAESESNLSLLQSLQKETEDLQKGKDQWLEESSNDVHVNNCI